ncbi:MAG TPA: GlxA family transcriptional regulator [Rhizomicrobium sp.]
MRIGLILPPGFETLCLASLTAFDAVNTVLGNIHYELHVVSANGGSLRNSFGVNVATERASEVECDTLLVGATHNSNQTSADLVAFLRKTSSKVRRIASISLGAFFLAEAGLIDGKRATTHWMFGEELQARFPKVKVEIDRIYIADGKIWSSAGMTAGIDLALGLIESDVGSEVVRETARAMVIHNRRAGGQSQRSALLEIDGKSDRVQKALEYARCHLHKELSIEGLAEVACLSERQFSRIFKSETGMTPAKAIENMRLERARYLLEQSRFPIEHIAEVTGFGDRERMRRSFVRMYNLPPQELRNAAPPLASI